MESSESCPISLVTQFYEQKSVLITGASGFLGKVLVEKLLRSVQRLEVIYLLIRPQNGLTAKERLKTIVASKLFDQLRDKDPAVFCKLIPIHGDLMQPNLGLSVPDMNLLCDNVSIVFHCAATIKFDEALRISVEMNVLGTQRLMVLCHKMHKLTAFVHASTAYANCDRKHIVESVYPPPVEPQKLVDVLEWMNDDMIESLTPHLIGKRPNTYTYTKALAEHVLVKDSGHLPVVIVRPSIIGAVWNEPLKGWVDNLNGPSGMFASVGNGLLRCMHGDPNATADIVPVDVVSNLMIVAAWYIATEKTEVIPVINCCSGRLNQVKWQQVIDALESSYVKYPMETLFRIPAPRFIQTRFVRDLSMMVETVPLYLADFVSKLMGKRPKLVRLFSKILKAVETLEYFTANEWDFQSKNIVQLWDKMTMDDKKTFPFDIRPIDWDSYIEDYCVGVKTYILKQPMENVSIAKKRFSRLKMIASIGQFFVYLVTFFIFWKKLKSLRPYGLRLATSAAGLYHQLPILLKTRH